MYESNRLNELDKNYISNGGFDFFQRTLSRVRTGALLDYDSADRFIRFGYVFESGAINKTSQRIEDAPLDIPAINCGEIVYTPVTSSAKLETIQRIESIFSCELTSKIVSFGIWVKQDNMQNIQLVIKSPSTRDDFSILGNSIYDQTVSLDTSGTWQFIKFENIQLDATVKKGLQIEIYKSNPIETGIEKNYRQTGLKLNIGKVARPFTHMGGSYLDDFGISQRYFEVIRAGGGMVWSNGENHGVASFRKQKRNIPSLVNTSNYIKYPASSTLNARDVSIDGFRCDISPATSTIFSDGLWFADSEL